jgi:hypothetical protein
VTIKVFGNSLSIGSILLGIAKLAHILIGSVTLRGAGKNVRCSYHINSPLEKSLKKILAFWRRSTESNARPCQIQEHTIYATLHLGYANTTN